MSGALEADGATARVWSYTPEGALPELVDAFGTTVAATREMHGPRDRLHLVGHSLGGIVAAATALRRDEHDVASVTTINTPWRGTWVSYTGTGPLARALRWGSSVLADLREDLTADLARPDGPRWLLVAAAGDLATPATTSLATGIVGGRLRRRVVAATGHSVSLTSERLIDVVRAHVRGDEVPEDTDAEDSALLEG